MATVPTASKPSRPRRRFLGFVVAGISYLALLGISSIWHAKEKARFTVVCGQAGKVYFAVMSWAAIERKSVNDLVTPTNAWLAQFNGRKDRVAGEILESPSRVGGPGGVVLTRRVLSYPSGTRISCLYLEDGSVRLSIQRPGQVPENYGENHSPLPYNREQILPYVPFAWMVLDPNHGETRASSHGPRSSARPGFLDCIKG